MLASTKKLHKLSSRTEGSDPGKVPRRCNLASDTIPSNRSPQRAYNWRSSLARKLLSLLNYIAVTFMLLLMLFSAHNCCT